MTPCRALTMLLLLLPLVALSSVEALKCYDCLSKALPECIDGSNGKLLENTTCNVDEPYCSVLLLNDSVGKLLIARQCASRKDEGEQLRKYIAATHDKKLKLVKFVTCKSDFCNTHNPQNNAGSAAHPSGLSLVFALVLAMVAPSLLAAARPCA